MLPLSPSGQVALSVFGVVSLLTLAALTAWHADAHDIPGGLLWGVLVFVTGTTAGLIYLLLFAWVGVQRTAERDRERAQNRP